MTSLMSPAYGLRIEVDDKKNVVIVRGLDAPGRGAEHLRVLVAVCRKGSRYIPNGNLNSLDDAEDVNDTDTSFPTAQVYLSISPATGRPGHGLTEPIVVQRDNWPGGGTVPVLLLMLYAQVEGVGGVDRRPSPDDIRRLRLAETLLAAARENHAKTIPEVIAYIADALERCPFESLRTGLITGTFGSAERREGEAVRFAVASCLYPADVTDGTPVRDEALPGPADSSLWALGRHLGGPESPSLLILAGDQIYIDATAGLLDPRLSRDEFALTYHVRGRSRGVLAVAQRLDLTVETVMDDHEVMDNWAPNDPCAEEKMKDGKSFFLEFQRGVREDARPARKHGQPAKSQPLWHRTEHRGLEFFFGDSRTEREGRTAADWRGKRIMRDEQRDALFDWLIHKDRKEKPKFVVTSAALLPRHIEVAMDDACGLHSDGWDGYPRAMHDLLMHIFDQRIGTLMFLSGDAHIPSVVTARLTKNDEPGSVVFHSVHSSGLHAPYPFANATKNTFAGDEVFRFPHPRKGPYICEVSTDFPDPTNGYAIITVQPSAPAVEVEFYHNRILAGWSLSELGGNLKTRHELSWRFPA